MLNVQMKKFLNRLIGEEIVTAQLIHESTMGFESFCENVAEGTAVSPANVAIVMTVVEMKLPMLLSIGSRIVCSPNGLTFRPTVSGSITQSQLKKKLEARAKAHPSTDYDVGRPLQVSDLPTADLSTGIAVDVPKKWLDKFVKIVKIRRVKS